MFTYWLGRDILNYVNELFFDLWLLECLIGIGVEFHWSVLTNNLLEMMNLVLSICTFLSVFFFFLAVLGLSCGMWDLGP